MRSRRQFLVAAGAGAVGLAGLSAGGVALGYESRDKASTSAVDDVREAASSAGYSARGRLGVHRIVWSASPAGPYAAVSFDDGPTPAYTPRILDALDRAGVRASFFVMGHNAVAHPELIREIVAAGHEIGNHTWSHLDQAQIPAAQIREEIVRCRDEVEQLIQRPLIGFRPPRGELTGYAVTVAAELGYDVFMWSCDRGPGGTSDPDTVARSIGAMKAGDVMDLHDGLGRGTFAPTAAFTRDLAARREVEVRALPAALRRVADRGISLTTVTDLLGRSASEPLPAWRTAPPAH